MGSREKLFAWGDAYDVEGTQQLFVDAVRENCAFNFHSQNNISVQENYKSYGGCSVL